MQHAQPGLKFIPPAFHPLARDTFQIILPILLRFRIFPWLPSVITRFETANVKILVELFQQFQAGKVRFLMAFRHAEVDDPLSMFYLLSHAVPREARQHQITLQYPLHSYFIYDRGMPLWAGAWLSWFFSWLGGIPVHRGKAFDGAALKIARNLFANGQFPIAVAPEGATNGHSEIVSPLEPGVAQLGFWCQEDLVKANRKEKVYIVPVGIKYHYVTPCWTKLDWLLSKLEADCHLPPVKQMGSASVQTKEEVYYQRLFRLAQHLLSQIEQFYSQFYHRPLSELSDASYDFSDKPNDVLLDRLQVLMDLALKAAEQYFGLTAQGTIIERCRRLEEASWRDIYRHDIPNLSALSPVEKGLANWIAQEAELRVTHMRLVETFVAVTGSYVLEKPTFERFAETTLLLFDLISRAKGKKHFGRPNLGRRCAQLTVGEPISVSDRWPDYHKNRLAARKVVADLTQELYISLQRLCSAGEK